MNGGILTEHPLTEETGQFFPRSTGWVEVRNELTRCRHG